MSVFNKKNFFKRLRYIAKLAPSRNDLAKAMEISPTTLRNYLQGAAIPKVDAIANLAFNLKINPCWLLLGHGEISYKNAPSSDDSGFETLSFSASPSKRKEAIRYVPPKTVQSSQQSQPTDPQSALLDKSIALLKEYGGTDEEIREAIRMVLAGAGPARGREGKD
jgi:transcriptional regulator with XRE-family HTH domain